MASTVLIMWVSVNLYILLEGSEYRKTWEPLQLISVTLDIFHYGFRLLIDIILPKLTLT